MCNSVAKQDRTVILGANIGMKIDMKEKTLIVWKELYREHDIKFGMSRYIYVEIGKILVARLRLQSISLFGSKNLRFLSVNYAYMLPATRV